MTRISITDLEKMMQTKYICTLKIKIGDNVLGDQNKHILEFDIFDGFAYCPLYKGKEYYMTYPKKKFINLSTDLKNAIKEFLNKQDNDITEEDILASYNNLHVL